MINATENKMTIATAEMTQVERSLIERSKATCARAVGLNFTIRTSKTVTVTGKIVSVEFGRFNYSGRTVTLVFKVTMECGANKTLREFFVTRVPQ